MAVNTRPRTAHLSSRGLAAALGAALLSGCLSSGGDLIPPEAPPAQCSDIAVTGGIIPTYSWTFGPIGILLVVKDGAISPVWGIQHRTADKITSPITHGVKPNIADIDTLGGSDTSLVTGAGYRVTIKRYSDGKDFTCHFTPTNVPTRLSAAGRSLNVKEDGSVWSWGQEGAAAPAPVAGLRDVIAVAGSGAHSLALDRDGAVWAWGGNWSGQLGTGDTVDGGMPRKVGGLGKITAIAAGEAHALALAGDGTVWAFGENSLGQLGDGTTENRLTPVRVIGLEHVVAISAGKTHSLAVTAEGKLWSWGGNDHGQLGDGTQANSSRPVRVLE